MIKNNFRILKKQYAYLQTILKTPVKFQKDWPKTVGGVADTRMVVGADGRMDGRTGRTDGRTDRQTDGRTDTQNFGGYNIIPRHFLVAGHKNCKRSCAHKTPMVNVDGWTDGQTYGWTNKRTETCMPKSPMLKQVRQ